MLLLLLFVVDHTSNQCVITITQLLTHVRLLRVMYDAYITYITYR